MRCFMRQVSWRSGKGYKQVDIMPIPIEGIHRGARGKRGTRPALCSKGSTASTAAATWCSW